jgi:hypothetical protein
MQAGPPDATEAVVFVDGNPARPMTGRTHSHASAPSRAAIAPRCSATAAPTSPHNFAYILAREPDQLGRHLDQPGVQRAHLARESGRAGRGVETSARVPTALCRLLACRGRRETGAGRAALGACSSSEAIARPTSDVTVGCASKEQRDSPSGGGRAGLPRLGRGAIAAPERLSPADCLLLAAARHACAAVATADRPRATAARAEGIKITALHTAGGRQRRNERR